MPKPSKTFPRNPTLDVIRDLLIAGAHAAALVEMTSANLTRAKRALVKREAIAALTAESRVMEATLVATLGEVSTWTRKLADGTIDTLIDEGARERVLAEYLAGDPVAHVGDILVCSWGYDQTNVDYYQVIRVSGKNAWIRKIRARHVGDQGGPTEHVAPISGAFVVDTASREPRPENTAEGRRVLIQRSTFYPYTVRIASYASAHPISAGDTHYQTGWGYGH